MTKLTDLKIKNLIKVGEPTAKTDGNGLTFTLSRNGTPSWILRYRFGGRQKELTLGRYPDITLAKARELALEARAKIQQGEDVAMNRPVYPRHFPASRNTAFQILLEKAD